jgi:hypothetical protein
VSTPLDSFCVAYGGYGRSHRCARDRGAVGAEPLEQRQHVPEALLRHATSSGRSRRWSASPLVAQPGRGLDANADDTTAKMTPPPVVRTLPATLPNQNCVRFRPGCKAQARGLIHDRCIWSRARGVPDRTVIGDDSRSLTDTPRRRSPAAGDHVLAALVPVECREPGLICGTCCLRRRAAQLDISVRSPRPRRVLRSPARPS